MIRSIFVLWLAVFVPLTIIVVPTGINPIQALSESLTEQFYLPIYTTSVETIEQDLLAHPESEWPKVIEHHNQYFAYPLVLRDLSEYREDTSLFESMNKGEIRMDYGEPFGLIKRLGDSNTVLLYPVMETEAATVRNQATGALYIAVEDLRRHPRDTWEQRLDYTHHELPIAVEVVKTDELIDGLQQQINEEPNQIISAENLEGIVLVAAKITPEEWILVSDQGSRAIQMEMNTAAGGYLFGLMSLALLLWVYPMWRDLKKLSKTANEFGRGVLDTRAKTSRMTVVSQLGDSFNHMADNIERLIAGQRELTNAISHDLRTPLYRLRFALEMMNDPSVSEAQKEKYTAIAHSSIDNLDHLINQNLMLSRYSKMTDLSQFSHCALAHEMAKEAEHFQLEHTDLNVEYLCAPELKTTHIFVDYRGIQRALQNLLSNAARYSKKQILVTFEQDATHYEIRVEDDGHGISEEMRSKIFEPFTQLDNKARAKTQDKGYGLGLAIVKQIAVWHRGEVLVEESVLGGARFVIRWPIDTSDLQAADDPTSSNLSKTSV